MKSRTMGFMQYFQHLYIFNYTNLYTFMKMLFRLHDEETSVYAYLRDPHTIHTYDTICM